MTWIVETLLASALLIAVVLVARRPAARLFGPHAAYLLWAAPALRLLLPPVPGSTLVPGAPLDLAPILPTSGAELTAGPALPQAKAARFHPYPTPYSRTTSPR